MSIKFNMAGNAREKIFTSNLSPYGKVGIVNFFFSRLSASVNSRCDFNDDDDNKDLTTAADAGLTKASLLLTKRREKTIVDFISSIKSRA